MISSTHLPDAKLHFLLSSICAYTANAVWRWVSDNKVSNDDFVDFDWLEDDVDDADGGIEEDDAADGSGVIDGGGIEDGDDADDDGQWCFTWFSIMNQLSNPVFGSYPSLITSFEKYLILVAAVISFGKQVQWVHNIFLCFINETRPKHLVRIIRFHVAKYTIKIFLRDFFLDILTKNKGISLLE